jgi:predicted TIM-barrel enzyme
VKHSVVDNSRAAILRRLREKIARGLPIIGAGAGSGLSAKCEEAGGVDLLIVYNSGRYRMAGRGSTAGLMPYGNANQIVKEMALEILPVVAHTPVLAGVCATDPFMILPVLLKELQGLGFSGVQNFPTVGLWEGEVRQVLEDTGMGFDVEVDCIQQAHAMDLLTTPYVFDEVGARKMMRAGADIVVAHMGTTTGGTMGARSGKSLDECVVRVGNIVQACRGERSDAIVLCHGGPIARPEDAQYLLTRVSGLDGFYGASSVERLPTEIAITEQVRKFNHLRLMDR